MFKTMLTVTAATDLAVATNSERGRHLSACRIDGSFIEAHILYTFRHVSNTSSVNKTGVVDTSWPFVK